MGTSHSSSTQFLDYNINEPSQIVSSFLFLGGHWSMNNVELLEFLGITHVLNLAVELPISTQLMYNTRIKTKHIYASDTEDYYLRKDFDTAFEFIDRARDAGGILNIYLKKKSIPR
jgi:hypothetical protein